MRVIVVGAGVAGVTAANAARCAGSRHYLGGELPMLLATSA